MECNEGVKRMKQTEELVCLEMLLDFSNVKVSKIDPVSLLIKLNAIQH